MLADPLVYLWPIGVSLFVAAAFAFVIIRGLATGRTNARTGRPVDRERHPLTFWLLAALYVASAIAILAVAFGIFWGPLAGR
jgi:hypothetical protein